MSMVQYMLQPPNDAADKVGVWTFGASISSVSRYVARILVSNLSCFLPTYLMGDDDCGRNFAHKSVREYPIP